MSQTHAHPDKHAKHNAAEKAMHEADVHAPGIEADPIPAPDTGNHPRSHAAHLDAGADAHTKPAGNLRQGSEPGALRQPPQEISRIGKQHR